MMLSRNSSPSPSTKEQAHDNSPERSSSPSPSTKAQASDDISERNNSLSRSTSARTFNGILEEINSTSRVTPDHDDNTVSRISQFDTIANTNILRKQMAEVPIQREKFQESLDLVKPDTNDNITSNSEAKLNAHHALIAYSKSSISTNDFYGVGQASLATGVNAGLTFGLGRGLGQSVVSLIPDVDVGIKVVKDMAGSLFGGILAGPTNYMSKAGATPLLNRMPIQIEKIPVNVILPRELTDLMNTTKKDSGTELAAYIGARQARLLAPDSFEVIATGAVAFGAASVVRAAYSNEASVDNILKAGAAIGAEHKDSLEQVGLATANAMVGSVLGGGLVGLAVGIAKVTEKVEIPGFRIKSPDLESNDNTPEAGPKYELIPGQIHSVNLFYSRGISKKDADDKNDQLRGSMSSTTVGTMETMANRSFNVIDATLIPSVVTGIGTYVADKFPQAKLALSLIKPLAISLAIKRYFNGQNGINAAEKTRVEGEKAARVITANTDEIRNKDAIRRHLD